MVYIILYSKTQKVKTVILHRCKIAQKMEIIRNLQQFYVKMSYFENENIIISINLNQFNNY